MRGETKRQQLEKAHLTATLKVHTQESVESQPSGQYVRPHLTVLILAGGGTSWPLLACGLRAPCTAICFLRAHRACLCNLPEAATS